MKPEAESGSRLSNFRGLYTNSSSLRHSAALRGIDTVYPMATHGSLLSRFDAAEYQLCRRLNRGVENTGIRLYFMAASRLGDGVIW